MQYLALIYSDEAAAADRPAEEQQALFQGYYAFNAHARDQGVLLAGEALQPTHTAKSVRVRDGERIVTDGPFAETREALGGFYLLECDSEEQALELAARIPTAATGTIEVRPILPISWDQ